MPRLPLAGASTIAAGALMLTSAVAIAQTIRSKTTRREATQGFRIQFGRQGGPGRWQIVADKTAAGGKALAQLSTNTAANRFLVAIYTPTVFINGEITTRCKPVSGRVDQACGSSFGRPTRATTTSPAPMRWRTTSGSTGSATANGSSLRPPKTFRLSGRWHTLALRAEGNRYTVSLNGRCFTRPPTRRPPNRVRPKAVPACGSNPIAWRISNGLKSTAKIKESYTAGNGTRDVEVEGAGGS